MDTAARACNTAGDVFEVGVRVVMAPGKRWQGVGSINRVHENGTTCAVKWDSGRLDRSLLINDLIVKKATGGSTPSKPVSDAPATPASTPTPSHAQTPSSPDKSYTPTAASAPKPAISAASPAKVTAEAVENTNGETEKIDGRKKGSGVARGLVTVLGLAAVAGAVVAFNLRKRT